MRPKRKLERRSAFALFAIASAGLAHGQYEYFTQTLSIQTNAVPIVFTETDNSGAGNLWRMPLDGGKLRFDVSASGFFDTYFTPLTLHSSGHVGISKNSPAAALHVGGGNPEIRFEYNGTDQHYGSLRWSGLQLGNNGANRIVAGRTAAGGRLEFFVNNTNEAAHYQQTPNGMLAMLISANGNVGLGTINPQNKLDVNGTIRAKEVIVESANWPDYVFEEDYALPSLGEVGEHIRMHGRLPGVPSADEIAASGISIGNSQRILLAKIEELTLYVMQLENDKMTLRSDMEALIQRVQSLEEK